MTVKTTILGKITIAKAIALLTSQFKSEKFL